MDVLDVGINVDNDIAFELMNRFPEILTFSLF